MSERAKHLENFILTDGGVVASVVNGAGLTKLPAGLIIEVVTSSHLMFHSININLSIFLQHLTPFKIQCCMHEMNA